MNTHLSEYVCAGVCAYVSCQRHLMIPGGTAVRQDVSWPPNGRPAAYELSAQEHHGLILRAAAAFSTVKGMQMPPEQSG